MKDMMNKSDEEVRKKEERKEVNMDRKSEKRRRGNRV